MTNPATKPFFISIVGTKGKMYCIPSYFSDSQSSMELSTCLIKPYTNTQKVEKAQILMETHTISFLLEGEKSVYLPQRQASFDNRSFIILKKGKCLMTEKLSSEGIYKSLLVFFDNSFLLEFFRKHNLVLPPASVDQSYSVLGKDKLLDSVAHSLLPYFDSQSEISPAISLLKVEELLFQIVRLHGIETLSFLINDSNSYRDVAFKKVVESNIFNHLSSAELAFLCNMSTSTFRRNFQQLYKTTPGKWFSQKRLEKAAELLRVNQFKPSEIYLQVGFESLSSFIHSFKQQYGLTPKQYQKA